MAREKWKGRCLEAERQLEGMRRHAQMLDGKIEDMEEHMCLMEEGYEAWMKAFCIAFGGKEHRLDINAKHLGDAAEYRLLITQDEDEPAAFTFCAVKKEDGDGE